MPDANPQFLAYFSGGHSGESRKMARNEFVKARVSPEEKEIYQQLCEQAGCTEAELIRSVLIHREISLDDLDDEMQVLDRKKKALHKQQEDYRRARASRKTDERGEPISEKRSIPFQVMLTAPEKKAIEQRAAALGISASELVRRSAIYGKIESFNFDIAEVEKLHHELLKEGKPQSADVFCERPRASRVQRESCFPNA